MDWLIAHLEVMGAACGAALAVWAFLSKLERTYRLHLEEQFATKKDFHRLEDKVDRVLLSAIKTINRAL